MGALPGWPAHVVRPLGHGDDRDRFSGERMAPPLPPPSSARLRFHRDARDEPGADGGKLDASTWNLAFEITSAPAAMASIHGFLSFGELRSGKSCDMPSKWGRRELGSS